MRIVPEARLQHDLAAEMHAADLGDNGFEPLVAHSELVALGRDRVALGDDGGMGGALGQDQGAQRINVVGERVSRFRHCTARLAEDEPERCRFWWLPHHRSRA
jgi:hypothetical protein